MSKRIIRGSGPRKIQHEGYALSRLANAVSNPYADDAELSKALSSMSVFGPGLYAFNPDDLVAEKGLKIYDLMKDDDIIKPLLLLKKLTILSGEITVEPASNSNADVRIAEFVRWVLFQQMEVSIKSVLRQMLSALDYGFSVTEKVYHYIESGPWTGKVGYRKLVSRAPHSFAFAPDEHGNLGKNGLIQKQLGFAALGGKKTLGKEAASTKNPIQGLLSNFGNVSLPVDKFIIYSYMRDFANYYGTSDLRSAYRSWWCKDILMKLWAVHQEKYGSPIVVARHPEKYPEPRVRALRQKINRVQVGTSMTCSRNIDIQVERFGPAVGFGEAITAHNTMIARSLLFPDLFGFSRTNVGSYALGKEQFGVFGIGLQSVGDEMGEDFTAQGIVPLVDINFPGVTEYPQLKIGAFSKEALAILVNVADSSIKNGISSISSLDDVNLHRKNFNMPPLAEEEFEDWAAKRQPVGNSGFITQSDSEPTAPAGKPVAPAQTKPKDEVDTDQQTAPEAKPKPKTTKAQSYGAEVDAHMNLSQQHLDGLFKHMEEDLLIAVADLGGDILNKVVTLYTQQDIKGLLALADEIGSDHLEAAIKYHLDKALQQGTSLGRRGVKKS